MTSAEIGLVETVHENCSLDINAVQINSISMYRIIRQWIGQRAGLWAWLRQFAGQRQRARRPVAVQLEFWGMTKR